MMCHRQPRRAWNRLTMTSIHASNVGKLMLSNYALFGLDIHLLRNETDTAEPRRESSLHWIVSQWIRERKKVLGDILIRVQ